MRIEHLLIRQKENEKVALKYADESLSFKDWYTNATEVACEITSLIDKSSKCVAIFLPNSIYYAIAYFGILFTKKVAVPIGVSAKFPEIFSTLEYCECDMVITDSKHVKQITDNSFNYKHMLKIILIDNGICITLNENCKFISKTEELKLEGSVRDVALMLHTSGTTNNPKRVMLSHENIISNVESNIISLGLTNNDIGLISLPMHFGYCNTAQFLTHLYLGATQVILENVFFAKHFFEIVEKEHITNFTAVPTLLLMILDYKYHHNYDYSSLKFICFGGGKMPLDKLKEIIIKFPTIGFIHTYGQTECSPRVTALLQSESLKKIGSVGKPIPNVLVKILSKNNNICGPYETGEIYVWGKNTMLGYFKNKVETQSVVCDGWIKTGDIGYLDPDGFLYINGREKNIIISGGINIYPEEIEEILYQINEVEDVIVYGEQHEQLGEIICAKVVKKAKSQITDKEIFDFCRNKMARYKIPEKIIFTNKIEKTYNGKIKR